MHLILPAYLRVRKYLFVAILNTFAPRTEATTVVTPVKSTNNFQ